jgi:DNA transformation protein
VDPEFIRELFVEFGPVAVRRMFGGAGLYADGVMFALVSGGQIYLKADAATVRGFEREGCRPFEYGSKTGKRAIMSYWRLPDRLYDDTDELARWARAALAVALKATPKSSKRKRRKTPHRKKAKTRKR